MQPNPELPEIGVKLAENEKDVLLLELFPLVAKNFLTKQKRAAHGIIDTPAPAPAPVQPAAAPAPAEAPKAEEKSAPKAASAPGVVSTVNAPLPGKIVDITVKVGDVIEAGHTVAIIEAMKMENEIPSGYSGTVRKVFVSAGDNVAANAPMIEIG